MHANFCKLSQISRIIRKILAMHNKDAIKECSNENVISVIILLLSVELIEKCR